MEFRCCSVAGMYFSNQMPGMTSSSNEFTGSTMNLEEGGGGGGISSLRPRKSDPENKEIKSLDELISILKNPYHDMNLFATEFLTLLAVCHTVIPEGDKDHPEGTWKSILLHVL